MDYNKVDRQALRRLVEREGMLEWQIKQVIALPEEQLQEFAKDLFRLVCIDNAVQASTGQRVGDLKFLEQTELSCGLFVSTVYTHICQYETAVVDAADRCIAVERYINDEYAEAGHQKWLGELTKCPESVMAIPIWAGAPETAGRIQLMYPGMKTSL